MTTTELVALSDVEQKQLEECEKAIKDGMDTFLTVGEALATIRDNKLFRASHTSFASYCKTVWDMGKTRAYQLIHAHEVSEEIGAPVESERVAREINSPEKVEAVKEKVQKDKPGKVTRKDVPKDSKADNTIKDEAGATVTSERMKSVFTIMRPDMRTCASFLRKAKGMVQDNWPDCDMIRTDIDNALKAVVFNTPYAVHPDDKGIWMNESQYKTHASNSENDSEEEISF